MHRKWIVFLLLLLCLNHRMVYSAGLSSALSSVNNTNLQQVATFRIKKNADRFLRKLRNEGNTAFIRKGKTKDGMTVYRVFVNKINALSKDALPLSGTTYESQSEKPLSGTRETQPAFGEKAPEELRQPSENTAPADDRRQIASYKIFHKLADAEAYAERMRRDGYEVTIHSDVAKDSSFIYTVFAEDLSLKPSDTLPSGGITDKPLPEKIPVKEEPIKKVILPSAISGQSNLAGSAGETKNQTPAVKTPPADKPVGYKGTASDLKASLKEPVSSTELKYTPTAPKLSVENRPAGTASITSQDVYGTKGGYVHPFISVGGYFTTNASNTPKDRSADFVTIISPGIFLTVPGNREQVVSINSSNIAPGGFSFSRYDPEAFRRYQFHLFYGANIELYSKNSSNNTVSQSAEGLFQYNLKGGLTLELGDRFDFSHDTLGTGLTNEIDKYKTNLASIIATYDTRSKFSFRGDYRNFLVDYDATRNDFRNRDDNALAGYVFYKIKPKTDVFVSYEFVDINYRENIESDSQEHHVWAGLQWNITAKSMGRIQAGYGRKVFSRSSIGDSNDFIYEAQIDHHFTPKTSAFVRIMRKTSETNVATTDYILSNGIESGYVQRLTAKLTGSLKLGYWNQNYRGNFTYNGVTDQRRDNIFTGDIGLRYQFKEGLSLDTGYSYADRHSNFSDFSYASSSVFFRLNGAFGFTLTP